MNTCAISEPTIWKRLGWKLLPPIREFISIPHPLPEGFKDVVIVDVEVHQLRFVDRLRILLWGKLTVNSVVFTELKPGNVESQSSINTA